MTSARLRTLVDDRHDPASVADSDASDTYMVNESVRIFVATIGTGPYHEQQRQIFLDLAGVDAIGHHGVASDPESADAILMVDLHQQPNDPFLRSLRRHSLVRRFRDKTFVYDERDLPFFTLPGIYVGGSARMGRRGVVGGPYSALPNTTVFAERVPETLFSFAGARTHPVRDEVLRLRHPRAELRDTTGVVLADSTHVLTREAREQYASMIKRSKFVLCPRGHGAATFRLYETLAAGRVPVVISDDWLPPPRAAWAQAIVRVAERRVRHLPEELERLEPEWPALRAHATGLWAAHFAPSRRWDHYAESIAYLRAARRCRTHPWWMDRGVLRVAARQIRGASSSLEAPGDQ